MLHMGDILRLGIMGGTFDPIHTGHLIVAEMSREQFFLDKVVFIPTGNPPHKASKELALPRERLEMVRLAINDNSFFDVSSSEVNRGKVSYTVDTLIELKSIYPKNTSFFLIIGEDSLLELKSWRNLSKILDMCTILVYGRLGLKSEQAFEEAQSLKSRFNASIEYVEGPTIAISSTLIRDMIKNDLSVRYLIPDAVREYIRINSVYRESII